MSSNEEMEVLKYPAGKYERPETLTSQAVENAIDVLAALPAELEAAIEGLEAWQMNTCYREGGWTVLQVVHHLADSHANAYIRIRLALTEDEPQIKTYKEASWAQLSDAQLAPAEFSLAILRGIHARLVWLLRTLTNAEWERTYIHPDHQHKMTVAEVVHLYAWHSTNHLGHIRNLRAARQW